MLNLYKQATKSRKRRTTYSCCSAQRVHFHDLMADYVLRHTNSMQVFKQLTAILHCKLCRVNIMVHLINHDWYIFHILSSNCYEHDEILERSTHLLSFIINIHPVHRYVKYMQKMAWLLSNRKHFSCVQNVLLKLAMKTFSDIFTTFSQPLLAMEAVYVSNI